MALTPCDPCVCEPGLIENDKFKSDVINILCQTLAALGYVFPGAECDPCACIPGNIPNDKFKQDVEILLCLILDNIGGGGGGGSVTSFSFSDANGIAGVVTNPTTTPNLTLSLGAITPTSVAASGTVTGSNLSGTNTGDQTITLTGDVTGTGTGMFATTIANDAVTFAKFQNITTNRLLGRATAGNADMEEITLGTGLSYTGTTLNASSTGIVKWLFTFFPKDMEPPSSATASIDTRNSRPLLNFDATVQQTAISSEIIPSWYTGGNIIVYLEWAAATAVAGTIGWDVTFERTLAGTTDIDADDWATAQVVTATTVPATSGVPLVTSVTITAGAAGTDSFAALDLIRQRIRRDVATDTATGFAQLLAAYAYEV